jgi:predicted nucleic acid-binding protein
MRLVVDASVLVAELLRARGRTLVRHSQLELVLASEAFSETEHELRKRVAQLGRYGRIGPSLARQFLDDAPIAISDRVTLAPPDIYAAWLDEALRRIPRNPNDAPAVALALALDCGIWTTDNDFLGCGVPVWTTETLLLHMETREGA